MGAYSDLILMRFFENLLTKTFGSEAGYMLAVGLVFGLFCLFPRF